MESNLQLKVERFIETFTTVKKNYKWSVDDLTMRFIALIYSVNQAPFHKELFDEMTKFIKDNTGWLSYYRGHQMYATVALLVSKFPDPKKTFLDLITCEEKLKTAGFKKSTYLFIAAYALLLTCEDGLEDRAVKAMELYKDMKKKHFWLTGTDDYPIAVLLSQVKSPRDSVIYEIETIYDALVRVGFAKSNGLQFMSHLLSLIPGNASIKAEQTVLSYDRLKQEKLRISSTYYGILGYFSLLGEFREKAVEDVIEVVSYLRADKNFKWTYKETNILAAIALVSTEYLDKVHGNELLETGIGISIEAMIAAETAALIAAISASTAAATAAVSAGS